MRWFMNLWFPFLGAGIRVTRLQSDWKAIDVEMKLRSWNSNYVGTHYGGSLYSMTDPFYMLMLIENLGRDYIVWDKAATIRFRKPGKGKVEPRAFDCQTNSLRTYGGDWKLRIRCNQHLESKFATKRMS